MRSKTMIYRPGTAVEIWGISLDTKEVDEHELPDYLADGWFSHPYEARDSMAAEPVTVEDMRATLEAEARSLGLSFDGRTTNGKLKRIIEEAKKSA